MNPSFKSLVPSQRLQTPFNNQTRIIHGGDYNPDQWLPTVPDILEQDAKLMRATGINSATVGVFAWSALEPSENVFTLDWLDRVFDQQAGLGNQVILSTPTGGIPIWLADKYPESMRVNRDGSRSHRGSRHRHCWSYGPLKERVEIINTKLAERYGKHPALAMWHVSNELAGECYCKHCRAVWAKWLEARHGSIDKLNAALWMGFWSHNVTDYSQVEPVDGAMEGIGLEWTRFNNDQLINWYKFEAGTLRKHSPSVPITTNFMTTSHGMNYQKIARVVDVVSDDQYPTYDPEQPDFMESAIFWSMKNDLYRCFKPERTFMLMESCPGRPQQRLPHRSKRPGVHRLEMLQAIAHGADGTCYFQFRAGRGAMEKLHGAVVEHWNTRHEKTRRFAELRALSDTYDKLSDQILGTSIHPEVAMVYDWESRWGQHLTAGVGVNQYNPNNTRHFYDQVAAEQYETFWKNGIPVDVIANDCDFKKYKVLILPMHWIMTDDLAKRLREYVAAGGTLVATWDTAMVDEFNRMLLDGFPGAGLTEVLGLWIEEVDRQTPGTLRAIKGLPGSGKDIAAVAHLEGASVIATFDEDYYKGRPAVTRNLHGKGNAWFIGTRLDAVARKALYGKIIEETKCQRILASDLPDGVTAQVRGSAEGAYLFLLNFTNESKTVQLDQTVLIDVDTDQTIKTSVTLDPLAAKVYRVMG